SLRPRQTRRRSARASRRPCYRRTRTSHLRAATASYTQPIAPESRGACVVMPKPKNIGLDVRRSLDLPLRGMTVSSTPLTRATTAPPPTMPYRLVRDLAMRTNEVSLVRMGRELAVLKRFPTALAADTDALETFRLEARTA